MRDQRSSIQLDVAESMDLSGGEAAVKNSPHLENRCINYALISLAAFGLLTSQSLLADLDGSGIRLVPVQTSTIPSNGDVNPYGVAFVPAGFPGGLLSPGDILVSNFNDSSNTQGTGTTIVSITPGGNQALFFHGKAPLGLTTALGVLSKGFVLVGNLPTNSKGVPQQGSLLIINKNGALIENLTDPNLLDGPWDLTVVDGGSSATVFVSCVLNGTVTRLDLAVSDNTVSVKTKVTIASGYKFGPNGPALVVGPTGLAYDPTTDTLYVASTDDNEIFAVTGAAERTQSNGPGRVIFNDQTHLHGPLGLALAPNGDLISSQGDAINQSPDPAQQSEIVEFTKQGKFIGEFSIDSASGAAFGIAINPVDTEAVDLAVVDDQIDVLTVYELSEN